MPQLAVQPVASAAKPGRTLPAGLSASDELAMFAMKCHLDGCGILDENTEIWSPIRSPLRCNSHTGKVEAIKQPTEAYDDGRLDSPLEPGLSKREVSFSTQMVRRAVSFIFNDPLDEDAQSPVKTRRSPLSLSNSQRELHSPHTAVAA